MIPRLTTQAMISPLHAVLRRHITPFRLRREPDRRTRKGYECGPSRTVLTAGHSVRTMWTRPSVTDCTIPASFFALFSGHQAERGSTMTHLAQALHTLFAVIKSGPFGHPIVTHHHLHRD